MFKIHLDKNIWSDEGPGNKTHMGISVVLPLPLDTGRGMNSRSPECKYQLFFAELQQRDP